jgi:hypothetical protein
LQSCSNGSIERTWFDSDRPDGADRTQRCDAGQRAQSGAFGVVRSCGQGRVDELCQRRAERNQSSWRETMKSVFFKKKIEKTHSLLSTFITNNTNSIPPNKQSHIFEYGGFFFFFFFIFLFLVLLFFSESFFCCSKRLHRGAQSNGRVIQTTRRRCRRSNRILFLLIRLKTKLTKNKTKIFVGLTSTAAAAAGEEDAAFYQTFFVKGSKTFLLFSALTS